MAKTKASKAKKRMSPGRRAVVSVATATQQPATPRKRWQWGRYNPHPWWSFYMTDPRFGQPAF